MEFTNDFIVPASVDDAWTLLTDVPRIAPCLPGAAVEPGDGGTYAGTVTVRVGPIKVGYRGEASFREKDAANRRLVLDARGTESGGRGAASALVTIGMAGEEPDRTRVTVRTELRVSGKVAQFGRRAMADVGELMIGRFADNLAHLLGTPPPGPASGSASGPASGSASGSASGPALGPARREHADAGGAGGREGGAAGLDALRSAGPLVRRVAPALGGFLVGLVVSALCRRLGDRRRRAPRAARS